MVDNERIKEIVNAKLTELDLFLVEAKVSPSNIITVIIDGERPVTIEACTELSRHIEAQLDRNTDNFELNVMSAGVGQPLQLPRQYNHNIGRTLTVQTTNGNKIKAKLTAANQNNITLCYTERVTVEGKKRKQEIERTITLDYNEIKTAKVEPSFK